jgi:aspartate aminotransferase
MTSGQISQRMAAVLGEISPFFHFVTQSAYAQRLGDPAMCDFAFGNPQEMALPGFVAALGRWHVPQHKDWYAYKTYEPAAQQAIAATLRQRYDLPFQARDILLTNGAFTAIGVALAAVIDPGDEVIFISPPWFHYAPLIVANNGRPVRVYADPKTFDLDVEAIAQTITPRTRAIIVNSPNNPTGRIYGPETLTKLGSILMEAGERYGRPIYLLSDEAYSRIVFDGREFSTPVAFYPYSFLLYTYGKTLLTPGQRLGYLALTPTMPNRDALLPALVAATVMTGFGFPNALMQYAVPDLEKLTIDVGHLQFRRDWMVGELQAMGYELERPEGTFYLLVRSPMADDEAFCEMLTAYNIFCLPGAIAEIPGASP